MHSNLHSSQLPHMPPLPHMHVHTCMYACMSHACPQACTYPHACPPHTHIPIMHTCPHPHTPFSHTCTPPDPYSCMPPPCEQTNMSKNINFPQLCLRAVKIPNPRFYPCMTLEFLDFIVFEFFFETNVGKDEFLETFESKLHVSVQNYRFDATTIRNV